MMRAMRVAVDGESIVIDHVARAPLMIFATPPRRSLAVQQQR
jgi:hypothetical protein